MFYNIMNEKQGILQKTLKEEMNIKITVLINLH